MPTASRIGEKILRNPYVRIDLALKYIYKRHVQNPLRQLGETVTYRNMVPLGPNGLNPADIKQTDPNIYRSSAANPTAGAGSPPAAEPHKWVSGLQLGPAAKAIEKLSAKMGKKWGALLYGASVTASGLLGFFLPLKAGIAVLLAGKALIGLEAASLISAIMLPNLAAGALLGLAIHFLVVRPLLARSAKKDFLTLYNNKPEGKLALAWALAMKTPDGVAKGAPRLLKEALTIVSKDLVDQARTIQKQKLSGDEKIRLFEVLNTDYSKASLEQVKDDLSFSQDILSRVDASLKSGTEAKVADMAKEIRTSLPPPPPAPNAQPAPAPAAQPAPAPAAQSHPSLSENPAGSAVGTVVQPQAEKPADLTGEVSTYNIIKELGKGGMGKVYLASNSAKKLVAAKVFPLAEKIDEITKEAAKPAEARDRIVDLLLRFAQEYKAGKRLQYDHICPTIDTNIFAVFPRVNEADKFKAVFEIDSARNLPVPIFIVTKFIPKEEGSETPAENLTAEVRKGITPDRAIELFTPLLEDLAKVHGQGVFHRDIKPSNIMLTHDALGNEMLVLIDLGIAKDTSRATQLTKDSQIPGSAHYMAPLATYMFPAKSKPELGRAIDIYEMGIVLLEALTRVNPFRAMEESEYSKFLFNPREVDVSAVADPKIQEIIKKMLAPKPEDNYQSMEEVVEAFKKIISTSKTSYDRSRVPAASGKPAVKPPFPAPAKDKPVHQLSEAELGQLSLDQAMKFMTEEVYVISYDSAETIDAVAAAGKNLSRKFKLFELKQALDLYLNEIEAEMEITGGKQ